MSALEVAQIAVTVGIGGTIAAVWVGITRNRVRHERDVLRAHVRAHRAHYAAVEAAEDDPAFSPESIRQLISEIVDLADGLWRTGQPGALQGSPFGSIVRAWARSREGWLGPGLSVLGRPSVDVIGVVNRGIEGGDGIVVRVRIRLYCRHPRVPAISLRYVRLDERWTLDRGGGRWNLRSMDGDPLAGPVLTAPLIPNPSFDTDRLMEESLIELANKQKVGDDTALAGLVREDEPPAFALTDLSVVDARFAPTLIAAELARLVETWELAGTGDQGPLQDRTSEGARVALLGSGPRPQAIVRQAVLKSWEPKALLLTRMPPEIELVLTIEAIRYVLASDGAFLGGREPRRMELEWTLELTDSATTPWRLAASSNPVDIDAGAQ